MAIPFDAPTEPHEFQNRQPIRHPNSATYLVIENLLKEILTLLRWAPIWAVNDAVDASFDFRTERRRAMHRNRLVTEHHERQRLQRQQEQQQQEQQQQQQQQQHQAQQHQEQQHPWLGPRPLQSSPLQQQQPIEQHLEQHQHTQNRNHVHHRNHGHQHQQQMPPQQSSLPDVVSSCGEPNVEVRTEVKLPANTLTLQVELCSECYQNGRRLKVVGVTELAQPDDGGPRQPDNDEEESIIVNRCAKVKQRIMSLLQPTNIDASLLTAVFVIVGWKMFMKQ